MLNLYIDKASKCRHSHIIVVHYERVWYRHKMVALHAAIVPQSASSLKKTTSNFSRLLHVYNGQLLNKLI